MLPRVAPVAQPLDLQPMLLRIPSVVVGVEHSPVRLPVAFLATRRTLEASGLEGSLHGLMSPDLLGVAPSPDSERTLRRGVRARRPALPAQPLRKRRCGDQHAAACARQLRGCPIQAVVPLQGLSGLGRARRVRLGAAVATGVVEVRVGHGGSPPPTKGQGPGAPRDASRSSRRASWLAFVMGISSARTRPPVAISTCSESPKEALQALAASLLMWEGFRLVAWASRVCVHSVCVLKSFLSVTEEHFMDISNEPQAPGVGSVQGPSKWTCIYPQSTHAA